MVKATLAINIRSPFSLNFVQFIRLYNKKEIEQHLSHDSSIELDQVHKYQFTPGISARLHKQSAFGKPTKFDW
jgi:hypothetical protein